MSKHTNDFFDGKRSWSLIKDKILEGYMDPYIAKVASLGQRIVLVDGYAGPGIFEDGKIGSPIIMCRAAEKYAPGKYRAIFVNKVQRYHDALDYALSLERYTGSIQTLVGDTTQQLPTIFQGFKQESVFLYLDPFGPTGCNFDLLKPVLERKHASTEVVLILHMPIMHRLAGYQAIKNGHGNTPAIQKYHQTLTNVFGDATWKTILLQEDVPEDKIQNLIAMYVDKISRYMPYTGFCPVQERVDTVIKYFIVFASHHPDTLILMNDNMLKIYESSMYEAENRYMQPLFSWEEIRATKDANISRELEGVILSTVSEHPGLTRRLLWVEILKKYFMRYQAKEYRKQVLTLVEKGILFSPTPRKTKLLNDDCVLYLNPRV